MADLTISYAANTLRLLADVAVDREAELAPFEHHTDVQSSDDESDSPHPIFNVFYNQGGAAAILNMTNFDPNEFENLWSNFRLFITTAVNNGRGRRSPHTPRDILFMVMTVFKQGGQWDFLGKMFGIKGPTFERLIVNFVRVVSDHIYEVLVTNEGGRWTMSTMMSKKVEFQNYRFTRYATDVTFQQSFRPSGSVQEGKVYFSGKHKLYGYKTGVSVLPNGLAINCSDHNPGSVSDIEIWKENMEFQRIGLRKFGGERDIPDVGPLSGKFNKKWAFLCDKVYQGATEFCRAIHSKKTLPNRSLSVEEERQNKPISSDRIIVENFFGRLCGLWGVMERKWKWSEGHYEMIFKLCVAFTNAHIRCHPLRAADLERFIQIKHRNYHIGTDMHDRRKLIQKRYREKRKRRMNIQFRADANGSEQSNWKINYTFSMLQCFVSL